MALRLLAYLGLGIDALARHEWLLSLLCFTTPFIGKFGMGTAFVVGIVFLVLGHYLEGVIAIGVVVFNLVGNQLMKIYDLKRSKVADELPSDNPSGQVAWSPFKKTTEKRLVRSFEMGLRLIEVSLYSRLRSHYSETMPQEPASAQVTNYFKGNDIKALMDNSPEPLRSKIAQIRDQIPANAANAMTESGSTREVIVATLRMREVLDFMRQGKAYLQSEQHQRIYRLLSDYGPEFPEEIKPNKYLALARRYRQEQFGAS